MVGRAEKQILGLDVTMADILVVKIRNCLENRFDANGRIMFTKMMQFHDTVK